jgi:hypothetical protein
MQYALSIKVFYGRDGPRAEALESGALSDGDLFTLLFGLGSSSISYD